MLKSYRWCGVGWGGVGWGGVGGPCDFSVSLSPFGLGFGTLDFGTSDSGLTICDLPEILLKYRIQTQKIGRNPSNHQHCPYRRRGCQNYSRLCRRHRSTCSHNVHHDLHQSSRSIESHSNVQPEEEI